MFFCLPVFGKRCGKPRSKACGSWRWMLEPKHRAWRSAIWDLQHQGFGHQKHLRVLGWDADVENTIAFRKGIGPLIGSPRRSKHIVWLWAEIDLRQLLFLPPKSLSQPGRWSRLLATKLQHNFAVLCLDLLGSLVRVHHDFLGPECLNLNFPSLGLCVRISLNGILSFLQPFSILGLPQCILQTKWININIDLSDYHRFRCIIGTCKHQGCPRLTIHLLEKV